MRDNAAATAIEQDSFQRADGNTKDRRVRWSRLKMQCMDPPFINTMRTRMANMTRYSRGIVTVDFVAVVDVDKKKKSKKSKKSKK